MEKSLGARPAWKQVLKHRPKLAGQRGYGGADHGNSAACPGAFGRCLSATCQSNADILVSGRCVPRARRFHSGVPTDVFGLPQLHRERPAEAFPQRVP
ncbi:hypothetical protein GCM10018785_33050 [Streptomyces longispororuber]|uniref:Uncharacterized protein n=1 Tax=Streptomyces longispororuber TaxID=68230 RepID=A0A918ZN17_9ACTN|nr:hypothetical protein GCM10018785_33050 [Streptomyces longispororuber]